MPIDKKIDTAVNHLFNYFQDNEFTRLEALYAIAIYQFLTLKSPLEGYRKYKLNPGFLNDFKEHL
jgi:hypothetical protein